MPPDPEILRYVGLLLQEIGTGTSNVTAIEISEAIRDALVRYENGESP